MESQIDPYRRQGVKPTSENQLGSSERRKPTLATHQDTNSEPGPSPAGPWVVSMQGAGRRDDGRNVNTRRKKHLSPEDLVRKKHVTTSFWYLPDQ